MLRVTLYREDFSHVLGRHVDTLIDHAALVDGRIVGAHTPAGQEVAAALGSVDGMGMHPVTVRDRRYFASVYRSER